MYRPNIIIIVMDSQRIDNLSCYGHPLRTSPNIDGIADEGVVFLNNFAPCAWTPPSHASLMTGRYYLGHQLLCMGIRGILPKEIPTIAEVLGSLGYETASFSNNHLVNSGEDGILRGFKECRYPLFEDAGDPQRKIWRVESKFFEGIGGFEDGIDKGAPAAVNVITEWIERKSREEKPFFLFVNFVEPHHPYWPPREFRRRFLPPGIDDERARKIPQMAANGTWTPRYPRTPEEWCILKSLLDGETAFLDHQMGILFRHLHELGIYDDTIIFITADHGDVLWEHSIEYSSHKSLYDANLHIPLIVKGPKEYFPPRRRVKELTQLVDIFPTILDVLGVKDEDIRRGIQGVSLLPAIEGERLRDSIIAELQMPPTGVIPRFWSKAIRNFEYKYIWHSDGREELYNIVEDPLEQNNLAEEERDKAELMRRKLEKKLLSIDVPEIRLHEHLYRLLIAWGYQRRIIPVK